MYKIMKSFGYGVMVVIVVLVMGGSLLMGEAQVQSTCSSSLSSLNACAPFVVPGSGSGSGSTPSQDCCGALQAVNHDCLCSTLRIVSRIPAQCNLPPLNCANN